jgi:hypothetical protein
VAGREGKRGSCQTASGLWFGAKPAQSETPVRARGQAGVHPEEGGVVERRVATDDVASRDHGEKALTDGWLAESTKMIAMPEWAKPVILTAAIGLAAYSLRKVPALIREWIRNRYDGKVVQQIKAVRRARIEDKVLVEGQICFVTVDEITEGLHREKKRVLKSLYRLQQRGIVEQLPYTDNWCLSTHGLVN